MAQNKVQYQRGLSMPEFFDGYGSAEQCEALVRSWRWPAGFVCSRCRATWHSEFRRHDRLYFQCSACRYQCSLVSGTVFESSKLPLPTWFLAMHLMTQAKTGVSALELKRHLGVSYPTAWLLKHKIMEVMRLREQSRQLTGRIEIDDAYLGGEVRGAKAGRGSPNKVPFVAAVQTTESGQPILMWPVAARVHQGIHPGLRREVAGRAGHLGLRRSGLLHGRARHGHPARTPRHRRRRGQRQAPVVPGRQYRAGQHQDVSVRHLPCVRIQEVLASLPRSGAVPVQPSLQPAIDSRAARSRGFSGSALRHTGSSRG